MSTVRKVLVVLPLFAALFALAAPAVALTPSAVGSSHAGTLSASSLAPVYIHFKPRSVVGYQGGTVTVTGVVWNNGSSPYTATSCILWYRLGTSGTWTKAGSCLSSALFPHTFSAHSKTKVSGSQKVASNFPTGTYQWKIQLVGTYNNHAADSHPGKLSVTIK
jgi:hypothetical protein